MAGWVSVSNRIIIRISITIEALRISRIGYNRISRGETADTGHVKPSIHIRQTQVAVFAVAGEAPVRQKGVNLAAANTAKEVEILVDLASGVSPDVTMDALYAFTDCEVSISPNACVIIDDKPHFITVNELLNVSTENTKQLLHWELEIKKQELEEKWHFAGLEKIFIEKRIYRDIEECETWEAVIKTIDKGLNKYVGTPSDPAKKGDGRVQLMRDVTEEDIVRLTEIKIKRISKYNSFKADDRIAEVEKSLEEVKHHLAHLIEYAINYYERLLEKYGKGKERRTEITSFDAIRATQVVANNAIFLPTAALGIRN